MLDQVGMRWVAVALIAAIVLLAVAHVALRLAGAALADVVYVDSAGQLCAVALASLTGGHLLSGGSGK